MKRIIFSLAILVVFSGVAFSQVKVGPYGKGIQLSSPDTSYYMHISGRMQFRYENGKVGGSSWEDEGYIRRARLKFDGYVFNPKLEYELQLSLSDRDLGSTSRLIRDAVVKWHFAKGWQLWFGQAKLPGNRERLASSSKQEFVDRAAAEGLLTLDRDIGFQIHHSGNLGTMVVREAVSVGMGEGHNNTATSRKGYNYTGRLELLPFGEFAGKGDYSEGDLAREKSPKLALGVAYSFNDHAIRQAGEHGSYIVDASGNYIPTDYSTLFVDAIFKYQGISLQGEFAKGSSSKSGIISATGLSYVTGNTFFVQGGYTFKNNFAFAGRFGSTKSDDALYSDLNPFHEYDFGVSKYISGHHLKLQSDIGYLDYDTGNDAVNFRLQLELSF